MVIKKIIGTVLWSLSESGILPPLGHFAPIVFSWYLGVKGKRIK